jgi:hypothetical protein
MLKLILVAAGFTENADSSDLTWPRHGLVKAVSVNGFTSFPFLWVVLVAAGASGVGRRGVCNSGGRPGPMPANARRTPPLGAQSCLSMVLILVVSIIVCIAHVPVHWTSPPLRS